MSNEDKKSRGNKVLDEWLDTGAKATANWGSDFIRVELPKALDKVVNEIKSTFSDTMKPQPKSKTTLRELVGDALVLGHRNALFAMVEVMMKNGYTDEQILVIKGQVEEITTSQYRDFLHQ